MSYRLRKKKERKQTARYPAVDKSLYLPYVNDSETPEEIMKKFEALEEFQKRKAEEKNNSEKSVDSADGYNRPGNSADEFVLDDNDLQELCNEIGTVFDKKIEEEDDPYEEKELSEEDEEYLFDTDASDEEIRRGRHGTGSARLHLTRAGRLIENISSKAVSRMCYKVLEKDGKLQLEPIGETSCPYPYEYIRVPFIIPLTWTHPVQDYEPPLKNQCIVTDDPISYDYLSLGNSYNLIYINTPYNYDCMNFQRLRLSRRLIPSGFVFIWADRENIPSIIDIFENKGFFYVENLVWVQSHDEDALQLKEKEVPLLRRSKRTLLILRRGRRKFNGDIVFATLDMRHQRNPDVVICPYSLREQSIMERSIYVTMETLVPRALDGGLDNSNFYLQIFGDSKFSRRVRTVGRSDL